MAPACRSQDADRVSIAQCAVAARPTSGRASTTADTGIQLPALVTTVATRTVLSSRPVLARVVTGIRLTAPVTTTPDVIRPERSSRLASTREGNGVRPPARAPIQTFV